MIFRRRPAAFGWMASLALALVFLISLTLSRIAEVEQLTQRAARPPTIDAASPTGYAGGVRLLIAPGHNSESYQWIAQTQQMIASGPARLRHVDYDNAPSGRVLRSPSPYRWWLAALAWCDHQVSGLPIGLGVERAALWADPLLLLLSLVVGTAFVATRFGSRAAVVFALLGVSLYPLGGAFLPGCPDDVGLALILSAGATLALLAGLPPLKLEAAARRRWFAASGVIGAAGLWLDVAATAPMLAGLAAGGLTGCWFARAGRVVLPWRTWGAAGAAGTIAAWLIEYAPAHLDLSAQSLTEVHPLYAVVWLAAGELLMRAQDWMQGAPVAGRWRDRIVMGLAAAGLVSVPVVMKVAQVPGFLVKDTFAFRLSPLGNAPEAASLWRWLVQETEMSRIVVLALPLLLLPAAGLVWRKAAERRLALSLVLGPIIIAIAFACTRLSWWSQVDALLLVLAVVLSANPVEDPSAGNIPRWCAWAAVAVSFPGIIPLGQATWTRTGGLAPGERVSLLERDFAHWLARRAGPEGAVILAPPDMTVSLFFHGGLRGLGTPDRSNEAGLLGTIRIAGAISPDEAYALAKGRQLSHIVLPAWDRFLDEYARPAPGPAKYTFMGLLQHWLPPRWLQPVPYLHPSLQEGAEDGIVVFEVTEVQDQAVSLSRLAEYFTLMGQFDYAGRVVHALAWDYGSDLGAQVAKAQTELAAGDQAASAKSIEAIRRGLHEHADDALPWDRRVSLALVLAEAGFTAEARPQAQRCMEDMGESELRHLPEFTLFRFLTLCRAMEIPYGDPSLRSLAQGLLSSEWREQI